MNIQETIAKGLALIAEGRSALAGVVQAVKDGKAVLEPGQTLEGLQAQLEREENETRSAIGDVRAAITAYRASQD